MQILVTTATTVGGVLFQAGDLILLREHEMLDYFGLFLSQIYALFGAFFTVVKHLLTGTFTKRMEI